MIEVKVVDNNIIVSYPFSIETLAIIKEFVNREYDINTKAWTLPLSSANKLIQRFEECKMLYKVEGMLVKPAVTFLNTPLFPHQVNFVYQMEGRDVIFLGDEQGLGKSLSSLALAVKRKNEFNYSHCLIVVGVNGLRYNWKAEIEQHTNEKCVVLGDRINSKGKLVNDGTEARFNHLKSTPEEYFWITNIETLRDKKFSDLVRTMCRKNIISMCIADEIHRCLHYDSLISTNKGFIKIGEIVENKLDIKVNSYNLVTNEIELKNIEYYHKYPQYEKLYEITIELANGTEKILKLTGDHKVYTKNRGYVEVKKLNNLDELISC